MNGTSKKWLIEYGYDSKKWLIEIDAISREDAERRLRALPKGEVLGELKATIPLKSSWGERIVKAIFARRKDACR